MLPFNIFKTVIKNTPLISIDLVVYNQNRQVLLGMRNNRPAKGYWFVPGGRIQKNESISEAFKRITMNELGVKCDIEQADFLGNFEHFYNDNVSGDNFSTHYIALGYRIVLDDRHLTLPIEQHNQYIWQSKEAISANSRVHKYCRWYLEAKITDD
ncbi:GDP-mannose mannosyl hydrolase [Vibrio ouci]|uniref:GDP-mannose mannosyl hydrolase n=1 Tax=Vibrio ouci TaxID=2499078 RepID=A0A4Y8WJX7_9VIBR|nr:GDP-mannose mannosyl hydrolase [Vibrio ouci]TFH92983.1 GDP-mannose mannosyl hydrolase [Vibrio ouci]